MDLKAIFLNVESEAQRFYTCISTKMQVYLASSRRISTKSHSRVEKVQIGITYNDQAYSRPRYWRVSVSWGPNQGPPRNPF